MLPKLHYYNPGHETAVLVGTSNYTPSKNVQKMIADLALLPAWYASPGDYVFVDDLISPRFFSTFPKELYPEVTILSKDKVTGKTDYLPKMEAMPWGLSPQSLNVYTKLKDLLGIDIILPVWNQELVRLTGRPVAAECFKKIKELLPDFDFPDVPVFFNNLSEIEEYLVDNPAAYILKTPYSSSGRGLLWLDSGMLDDKDRKWINGALAKQGVISIEKALNKWNDFALEFYSDGDGEIGYRGISLFGTSKRGAYKGNEMISQSESESILTEHIGKDKFWRIREAVRITLKQVYGSLYKGYIGIDMLMYKSEDGTIDIHPCIEINMRYTMGMAAISIFDRYIHKDAIGIFDIIYESRSKIAYERHKLNKKAYPLEFENGKLRTGYFSLCPITKNTNYTAFIIVQ